DRLASIDGLKRSQAIAAAAQLVRVSEMSVRRWVHQYQLTGDELFARSLRGAHPKLHSYLADEGLQEEAKAWVREHSHVKGERSMTIEDFRRFIVRRIGELLSEDAVRLQVEARKAAASGSKAAASVERAARAAADAKSRQDSYKAVCRATACMWLHRLGFSVHKVAGKKRYVDGHERDDVIAERSKHLEK